MIKDKNIVCIGSSWYIDPTSKHQVMKRLSRRNSVIWVNYHASRRPQLNRSDLSGIKEKLRRGIRGADRISETLRVLTPLVVPLPGSLLAQRVNRSIMRRLIRRELKQIEQRPVQLWSFAPDVSFLAGAFREELVVYYCVDEFSEFGGYDQQRVRMQERQLLEAADLVITTSQALQDSKSAHNPNTHLVTHGVDYRHFRRALEDGLPAIEELKRIQRPILGFFGLIQDWVDLELIANLARARPQWSIVLVGDSVCDVSELSRIDNVHLLGRRKYEDLPRFARSFDVGLIPFRINELTRNVNPIKLREYLAAGLPVVSTPLPEVVRYRSLVDVVDAGGFLQACESALADDTIERRHKRSQAMETESWDAKVETLSSLVHSTVGGRDR